MGRLAALRVLWACGALSIGLAVGGAGAAGADTPIPVPFPTLASTVPTVTPPVDVLEATLLAKLNAERAAAGLQALVTQPWAQSVARAHSQDMAAARTIWHNHSGYLDIAKQAINAYLTGENVAEAGTLDETDKLLMTSLPHRANILYPAFNYVGIGVALDVGGYVYVTQDFVTIRPPTAITARAATSGAATAPARRPVPPAGPGPAPSPPPTRPAAMPTPAPAPSPSPSATTPLPRVSPLAVAPVATIRRQPPVSALLWALMLMALVGNSGAWFVRRRQGHRGAA